MPDTPAYRDLDTPTPPANGWPIYRRPGGTAPTDNAADTFDPNPHYGRVGYVYASGVDQPIAAHRLGYGDRPFNGGTRRPYKLWNPFALYPVWDVRGEPGLGVTLDGGLWPCEGTGSTKRCVQPMAWTNLWAANGVAVGPVRPAWVGTVLEDKREASGLLYRRNRYLDGATGRFTQPDPIGLAGGLNSYGYAAGDPVNFSDPFGLCPIPLSSCFGRAGADVALSSVPVVSTLLDAATLISGKNIVTGEDGNRLVALAGLVTPAGGGHFRAGGNLVGAISDNLRRFEKKLPAGAMPTQVRDLPLGGKAFQAEVPGRVPGSRAIYEKQVDASGTTLQYTKTTVDPKGNIVHVKDKMSGRTITP